MSASKSFKYSRRRFLGTSVALASGLAMPAIARDSSGDIVFEQAQPRNDVRHNISSFRSLDWRPYFSNTRNGAILVDVSSRALHFWSDDQSIYKLYPTSVPISEDLTRRGRTKVIRKVEGPSWAPTPAMKKRNPEWPDFIPPGPTNPLGTHALYLTWTYYRIHGTQDTRKIGRKSSNGCIGLYNENIAELYALTKNGTQVLII
ncbi:MULTISPECIES: L,D-transpeptidase [Halocynthiibacter]|uniref:L,D-transpeptidase n=1 Tax=Halocynthiibacter halioticoli TaxID=2986804 RepID=A0AAE3J0M9_9RHOB|nr:MULTISPECIES: L,D-transpeptidase [Halocynthiibacter]MCV6825580.1 L,D-transpeptidase [Halocynthiibacter halioticoli]MCW4058581.1 L,D-transpeptidase [Halocynthiibacter sp. SDUM655004]MDE0590971.1 L,D-transpeptidase [Halocynthiibacter sp. C4]